MNIWKTFCDTLVSVQRWPTAPDRSPRTFKSVDQRDWILSDKNVQCLLSVKLIYFSATSKSWRRLGKPQSYIETDKHKTKQINKRRSNINQTLFSVKFIEAREPVISVQSLLVHNNLRLRCDKHVFFGIDNYACVCGFLFIRLVHSAAFVPWMFIFHAMSAWFLNSLKNRPKRRGKRKTETHLKSSL